MAIVVRISVNSMPPMKVIEIQRVSNTDEAVLDPDTISLYQVREFPDAGGPPPRLVNHRYGNPVENLVINALTALKETRA